jgi:hypothetical protein
VHTNVRRTIWPSVESEHGASLRSCPIGSRQECKANAGGSHGLLAHFMSPEVATNQRDTAVTLTDIDKQQN